MSSIRWEDMVFMNRNQSYGAYVLRKAYPDRVNLSFVFAMMAVALILATPTIRSLFKNQTIEEPKVISDKFTVIEAPPPITLDELQKLKLTLPDLKTIRFVPPRVTEREVVDETPTMQELLTTTLSTETNDGEPIFIEDAPAVDLPATTGEDLNKVWTFVEIAPEFPGGVKEMMKFIATNIKYPAIDRRLGNEGTTYVSFIIDTDGTITDIKTDRGFSGTTDEEAMRVIAKMPKWKPGRQGGSAVKVRFILPIKFKLGS